MQHSSTRTFGERADSGSEVTYAVLSGPVNAPE